MNGFHPNVARAVSCALAAAALAAGGCKSTSSGVNNPFLAPDRVAPPSTRALAPGQAQPYYPGDPLPVMQSGTAPPANNVASASSGTDARSSSGRTLAWNAPAGAAPAAQTATTTASPWDPAPKAPAPIAYGNEQPVAVPTDTSELRFALPTPGASATPTPIAAAAPQNLQPNFLATAAPPQNQNVVLASYSAPTTRGLSPVTTPPTPVPTPPPNSPWRTPQIEGQSVQPSPAPMYGIQASPYQAVVVQPVAPVAPVAPLTTTNQVAVQLRSVPAPPPQPGDPMPRIRIPGYEVPQTAAVDGFRPRTAMR